MISSLFLNIFESTHEGKVVMSFQNPVTFLSGHHSKPPTAGWRTNPPGPSRLIGLLLLSSWLAHYIKEEGHANLIA
jgi:hypothetical protein